MRINNVFNTVNAAALYRITMHIRAMSHNITSFELITTNGTDATVGNEISLQTYGNPGINLWIGVDFTTTIQKSYRHLKIKVNNSVGTFGTQLDTEVRNLHAYHLQKAQVQDSELNWAGRRTSYYEGTKITSTDINVDSADTIDGGPVITVNTVNSDQPSYDPLGVSTIITGTTNTNQSQ